MPSEMVQEAIREMDNAHLLAKGPWALGGRDDAWSNSDADAGVTRPGKSWRGDRQTK